MNVTWRTVGLQLTIAILAFFAVGSWRRERALAEELRALEQRIDQRLLILETEHDMVVEKVLKQ